MTNERSDIEDQLLVMDAQDGDALAMDKLVRRWQKRLWRHAFRLTADAQAAWDITQQSWLGVIKGLGKLNDPASFKTWVYRITTNKSIDWIRRNKAVKNVSIGEIQARQDKEKKDICLKELLGRLDIRKQAVLTLYYFEQLDVSEIRDALNIPKGTVKSRLHNAREELRELWRQYFE
jgi:RNA polymerase sigma-70 factor (ECF subfamily)